MLTDDGRELLTEMQCFDLLNAVPVGAVGRVGVTISGLPVILPVHFAFIGGAVVFRTGVGTKLDTATRDAVVAFEIDDYDTHAHVGWSVLVIGRAAMVDGDSERAVYAHLDSAPWSHGESYNYVRVHPEMMTGRRLLE